MIAGQVTQVGTDYVQQLLIIPYKTLALQLRGHQYRKRNQKRRTVNGQWQTTGSFVELEPL